MSKVQPKPAHPPEPAAPAPKKQPASPAPPPFTLARPRVPLPPAPMRPARAGAAASSAERAREAASGDPRADPNGATRFDSGNAAFFKPFGEEDEPFGKRGGSREAFTGEAGAVDRELDSAELASLLPVGGNDGIFDVALPGGERLGVVVSGQSGSLSYLLSPSSDKLGSRLRRQRMELECRVERLTHRNVNITVL